MISLKICRTKEKNDMQKLVTNITFISGYEGKIKQLQAYLQIPIAHKKLDLIEIQSLDTREVIAYKTKEAYTEIGTPVLVEDTSLVFHILGRLPGTLVKWFLKELGHQKLCRLADLDPKRQATATVSYGLYDGKSLQIFSAEMQGHIALHPKGENGIGWDSIFIPEGTDKTRAEMNDEELAAYSPRRMAAEKLEAYLKSHL